MAKQVIDRYKRDDAEFDRAIAFIDATFAVALTLLVTTLDLGSDPSTWRSFGDFYDAVGSQLLSFGISFVVIAGYWLAHYRLVATWSALDVREIAVNLLLLAAIVLFPFTSEAAGDPSISHLPLPAVILAVNVAAVSIAFMLVYVTARRRGILRTTPSPREFRWTVAGTLTPAVVFLLSIPIAYAATPDDARLFWLVLFPLNACIGIASARGAKDERGSTAVEQT
jgi:uncharacterized membrane protein